MRKLREIADEIERDWLDLGKNEKARIIVERLKKFDSIDQNLQFDGFSETGKRLVAEFLSTCSGWQGAIARRVKLELNELIR